MENIKIKKEKALSSREKKNLIFYITLVALPLLQFCVFYIYVNFNSFKLAFWTYQEKTGMGYESVFAGVDNFVSAFKILWSKNYMILNSLKYFGVTMVIGLPLSLIFSFYLYKKYLFSGLFRVVLFLPQIVSGLIFSILFKEIVNVVYPQIVEAITGEKIQGLMTGKPSDFGLVVFFSVWISFGINTMMFSNAMSGISVDIVEAASLDGANIIQEFWFITLPSVYGTIVSIFIIMLMGLFTDQMNLYSLYGMHAEPFGTLGYFLYKCAIFLTDPTTGGIAEINMSILSAMGLILTFIMVPLTMGTRKLLNRFGPSDEREGKRYA